MKEQEVTRFVQSRNAFFIVLCVSFAAAILAFYSGKVIPVSGNDGFGLPSFNEWISNPEMSLYVGLGICALQSFLLVYINRRFNLLKTVSPMFAGAFLVMQCGLPSVLGQVSDGSLLCLLVLLAIIPLFSVFQRPQRTRSIYLVFCIIAFGTLTDYSYLAYLVAFLIGCLQMQCLSFRGILAMLLGMITPIWILVGLGYINPADFKLPEFVSVFEALNGHQLLRIIVYTAITLIIGCVLGTWNLIKIYSYNSRTRAYNGFWMVLSVTTVALLFVDYFHWFIYIPMLNCCTAVQIGHFFAINQLKRGYFLVVCFILVYAGIYIWNFVV